MSALRRIRVDRELTVVQLAAASDVSPEQIRNIEAGRARNPHIETLSKLAKALDVAPSAIDPMLNGARPAA